VPGQHTGLVSAHKHGPVASRASMAQHDRASYTRESWAWGWRPSETPIRVIVTLYIILQIWDVKLAWVYVVGCLYLLCLLIIVVVLYFGKHSTWYFSYFWRVTNPMSCVQSIVFSCCVFFLVLDCSLYITEPHITFNFLFRDFRVCLWCARPNMLTSEPKPKKHINA
jgi:hypothetical protein